MAQEVQRILIKYEADIKELRKDLDGVKKEMRGVEREVQTRGKAITNTFKAVGTAALAAFSVREVIQLGKELNNLQREAQGVKRSFDAVFDQGALSRLRTATAGTVSDLELMKVALRGREFGIPEATLARGLEFARVQANKLGEDIGFLTNSIVDGLGRKSPLILDNLGISQAELSQKVKETGDFYEGVAAVIEGKLGEAGASGTIETLADRQARVNAQLENLRVRLSEQLVPFFDALTTAALNSLDAIEQVSRFGITVGNEATQRAREEAEATFKAQRESLVAQVEAGKLSNEAARALIEGSIQSLEENFQRVQDGIDNTGEKTRRFLSLITGAGGTGIAQALGQAGLGKGAREGAEELVKLDAEIEVLRASLGLFQDDIEDVDKNLDGAKKAVASLAEELEMLAEIVAFNELFDAEAQIADPIEAGALRGKEAIEDLEEAIREYAQERNAIQDEGVQDFFDVEQEQIQQRQEAYSQLASVISSAYQQISQARRDQVQADLEAGRISEEEARRQLRAQANRELAITGFEIFANQATAIAKAVSSGAKTPLLIPGIIAGIIGFFGQAIALQKRAEAQLEGFAVGTSDAPGGAAWVGEKGPEIVHLPKGSRVFTADASKKERKLIDAINEGKASEFIESAFVQPALSGFAQNITQSLQYQNYDDFFLRQDVKGLRRGIELGPKTIRALSSARIARFH